MASLKNLSVSFLSLVKTPATGKGLTLKSLKPGQRATTFEIIKTDDERMIAYGIVYAPEEVDAHGDTADAATIRKAAYEFMREGRLKNVDTEHSFSPETAYVAESWLVRKGDELFPDEPEGAWAVGIQIGDPDIWKALKNGDLTGISLAGIARHEPSEPRAEYTEKGDDTPPGWFTRLFPTLKQTPKETQDMDENKVREIVRAEVGDAVKEALKSTPAPATPEAGSAPAEPEDATAAAISKAFESLEAKLDDKIAKAVAKGVTEADTAQAKLTESFV